MEPISGITTQGKGGIYNVKYKHHTNKSVDENHEWQGACKGYQPPCKKGRDLRVSRSERRRQDDGDEDAHKSLETDLWDNRAFRGEADTDFL